MQTTRRGFLEALAGAVAALAISPKVSECLAPTNPIIEDWVRAWQFGERSTLQERGRYCILTAEVAHPFALRRIGAGIDSAAPLTTIARFLECSAIELTINRKVFWRAPAHHFFTGLFYGSGMPVVPQIMMPEGFKCNVYADLTERLPESLRIDTCFDGVLVNPHNEMNPAQLNSPEAKRKV